MIDGSHFTKCEGILNFCEALSQRNKKKCKAKYFISCTKVSSCNNNIQAQ